MVGTTDKKYNPRHWSVVLRAGTAVDLRRVRIVSVPEVTGLKNPFVNSWFPFDFRGARLRIVAQ
jgi:hypothetical protein